MEIFKKIEDFNGYSISNLGTVKNNKTNRILKLFQKREGYLQVQLGRKNNPVYVHRLVAKAFIPNIYNKKQVNHVDGNKQNNCVENLEWCDARENYFGCGYANRINNKRKKILATHSSGSKIIFNSRYEATNYFGCSKACLRYGKVYNKGNKKGFKFELMI
jgi:NUMOD4 motif./HNH endonuclease.